MCRHDLNIVDCDVKITNKSNQTIIVALSHIRRSVNRLIKYFIYAHQLKVHYYFKYIYCQTLNIYVFITPFRLASYLHVHVFGVRCMYLSGAAVAEWLSSWLAEQEDRGSIPGLAIWIFRDWLSPASKSRYGWKIAKSTLILKTTNNNMYLSTIFKFLLFGKESILMTFSTRITRATNDVNSLDFEMVFPYQPKFFIVLSKRVFFLYIN